MVDPMSLASPKSAAAALSLVIAAAAFAQSPVQVNVSAIGLNIVGDAANEPSLAVDPTNPRRMAIGWRHFDTISSNAREAGYGWSEDGGRTWHFPGVLENNVFRSDPLLASLSDGTFLYCSMLQNYYCQMFRSDNGGQSWPSSVPSYGGDKSWMAVDLTNGPSRDHVYLHWSTEENPYPGTPFVRSIDGGLTFDAPVPMADPIRWGTLAVGAAGELFIAGVRSLPLDSDTFLFTRSDNARDPSQTVTFTQPRVIAMGGGMPWAVGPNPSGLLAQVWIDVDRSDGPHSGRIYILSGVDPAPVGGVDDPLDVHLVHSDDGGTTWSAHTRVNPEPRGANSWNWHATMSVAPNGRIDVVWLSTHEAGSMNIARLYSTSSSDGGATFAAPIAQTGSFNTTAGWPQQQKMGDYFHMISDLTGADLAFCTTVNGEQDVYYLRIGPRDCNGDGIPDACAGPGDLDGDGDVDGLDLAMLLAAWGTSEGDFDGNGITDGGDMTILLSAWTGS